MPYRFVPVIALCLLCGCYGDQIDAALKASRDNAEQTQDAHYQIEGLGKRVVAIEFQLDQAKKEIEAEKRDAEDKAIAVAVEIKRRNADELERRKMAIEGAYTVLTSDERSRVDHLKRIVETNDFESIERRDVEWIQNGPARIILLDGLHQAISNFLPKPGSKWEILFQVAKAYDMTAEEIAQVAIDFDDVIELENFQKIVAQNTPLSNSEIKHYRINRFIRPRLIEYLKKVPGNNQP